MGEDEREQMTDDGLLLFEDVQARVESRDFSVLLFVLFKMTRLTALMKESPTRR